MYTHFHIPSRRTDARRRKGVAIVEMAVVTPLLVTLLLGIIEFAWLFHVKSCLTTASRVGARSATLPGAEIDEIEAEVEFVLASMGFPHANYPYYFDPFITMADEDNPYVTVPISIDWGDVSLTGGFFGWLGIEKIGGSTTLRHEVTTSETG